MNRIEKHNCKYEPKKGNVLILIESEKDFKTTKKYLEI